MKKHRKQKAQNAKTLEAAGFKEYNVCPEKKCRHYNPHASVEYPELKYACSMMCARGPGLKHTDWYVSLYEPMRSK